MNYQGVDTQNQTTNQNLNYQPKPDPNPTRLQKFFTNILNSTSSTTMFIVVAFPQSAIGSFVSK